MMLHVGNTVIVPGEGKGTITEWTLVDGRAGIIVTLDTGEKIHTTGHTVKVVHPK